MNLIKDQVNDHIYKQVYEFGFKKMGFVNTINTFDIIYNKIERPVITKVRFQVRDQVYKSIIFLLQK